MNKTKTDLKCKYELLADECKNLIAKRDSALRKYQEACVLNFKAKAKVTIDLFSAIISTTAGNTIVVDNGDYNFSKSFIQEFVEKLGQTIKSDNVEELSKLVSMIPADLQLAFKAVFYLDEALMDVLDSALIKFKYN